MNTSGMVRTAYAVMITVVVSLTVMGCSDPFSKYAESSVFSQTAIKHRSNKWESADGVHVWRVSCKGEPIPLLESNRYHKGDAADVAMASGCVKDLFPDVVVRPGVLAFKKGGRGYSKYVLVNDTNEVYLVVLTF